MWTKTGWELDYRLLEQLIARLDELRPRKLLELGSGRSTVELARWANANGASLTTIEHDTRFARQVRRATRGMTLDYQIRPLVGGFYAGVRYPDGIDFALIDGPPGSLSNGRSQTLPMMWPYLSDGAEVWLDDADRPAEAESVARWQRELPVEVVGRRSRVAVLRK